MSCRKMTRRRCLSWPPRSIQENFIRKRKAENGTHWKSFLVSVSLPSLQGKMSLREEKSLAFSSFRIKVSFMSDFSIFWASNNARVSFCVRNVFIYVIEEELQKRIHPGLNIISEIQDMMTLVIEMFRF